MAHRVYVIELDRAAGRRRDPRIPWVYVGTSARTPARRFAQHRDGYRAARLVKRFGLWLRPDLYEDLPAFSRSRDAAAEERSRARDLTACGFVAHSDGVSYGRDEAVWEEWGAERLEPVIAHVDAAAGELAECSFRPLDGETCVRLLRGEPGFWVADYIDQLDPPPAYGRFAHVRPEALLRRVDELELAESSERNRGARI